MAALPGRAALGGRRRRRRRQCAARAGPTRRPDAPRRTSAHTCRRRRRRRRASLRRGGLVSRLLRVAPRATLTSEIDFTSVEARASRRGVSDSGAARRLTPNRGEVAGVSCPRPAAAAGIVRVACSCYRTVTDPERYHLGTYLLTNLAIPDSNFRTRYKTIFLRLRVRLFINHFLKRKYFLK